jgi:hypothetical protein
MYAYITVFSPTVASTGEEKKRRKRGTVPLASTRVQHSLQAFQDESDCGEGVPNYLWKLRDVFDRWQAQVDQDVGYPHELP